MVAKHPARIDGAAARWAVALWLGLTYTACGKQQPDVLRAERSAFQNQEIMPSRSGAWLFAIGQTPQLIWRDVDAVRRLGRDVAFDVRWFNAQLEERPEPDSGGRWMAWLEGQAPNDTPFRRSFTFFVLPPKIDTSYTPDLTIEFPNFPGPNAPPGWAEHQFEFDRLGREFLTRAFIDSELGAILAAGLAETQVLGRRKRYAESTAVMHAEAHLALKLKLLGLTDRVSPLAPPRWRETPAATLRAGAPQDGGIPDGAKQTIDAFCQEWAAATREPFVVLIAKDGFIVTHAAFGVDVRGRPIDLEYRAWVASITKTVTAIMFLQFVDQGRILLDAPLSSVFPDYPADHPSVPTFRQCLTHTSGLSGHGEFGGMNHPHLENIVLNGLDVNEPGTAHSYSGLGFELAAKAMELVSGKSAVRVFDEHLFQPLGFGDVVMGNASSDGEFTARELAILGQWILNHGSYGELEFVSRETFAELLPKPLDLSGATVDQGLGIHAIHHRRPPAESGAGEPGELLFGPRAMGHGSFSGSILMVDPDQRLVIAQARRSFRDVDDPWFRRFFAVVADALR